MVRSWIAHSTVVRTVPVFWINLYILLRLLAIIQGLITTNSIMFSVWLYNQCKVSDYSSLIIRASDNKLDNKQIFSFTSNACWWLCYKFIMSHWFWCTSQVWRMLSRFFCSQKLMCIKLKIKQSRWGEEKWTTSNIHVDSNNIIIISWPTRPCLHNPINKTWEWKLMWAEWDESTWTSPEKNHSALHLYVSFKEINNGVQCKENNSVILLM